LREHAARARAGHDILMATMLNGAAVMDGALLLIAANETCPQPQTSEHLAAVEIMKLQHIIILQNKIDLIRRAARPRPRRAGAQAAACVRDARAPPAPAPAPDRAAGRAQRGRGGEPARRDQGVCAGHDRGGRAGGAHLGAAQVQHRRRVRVHRQEGARPDRV
jgi:hypothetical protein